MLAVALLIGTVACLGSIAGLKVKADTPTITGVDGIERTPGQHGSATPKTKAELDAMYPSGIYNYLSGTAYEFEEGYTPNYDFLNHITPTDGYVQPGDYVLLTIKTATNQAYMGVATFWFAHTFDFFDNVNTTSNGSTNLPIAPFDASNTSLETFGAIVNPNNTDVSDSSIGLTFAPTTQAINADSTTNVTKSGYTSEQLQTIGLNKYVGDHNGSKIYYQNEDDTWCLAIMYKVKDNLEDGAMGSIYIPATDADHSFWKIPGMTKAQAGRRTATIATSANGTAAFHTYQADNFDYNDFGATFVVGNPPEEGDTYTVTFYDADGETVLYTDPEATSPYAPPSISGVTVPEGKVHSAWAVSADAAQGVSFPYELSGDTQFYPVFEDLPTITGVDGIERTPGQHGSATPKTKAELDAMYPSGIYNYLSGTAYEFEEGYTPNYDFLNHITPTDGYVQPGDYVLLTIKTATNQAYMGVATFWFAHTFDFFDNVNTTSNGSTNLPIAPFDASNTSLETFGAIVNPNNTDVSDSSIGLTFAPTTQAINADSTTNVTKSGYTSEQLQTIGLNKYVGDHNGSKIYYQNEDDTWCLAIMYKVKDNLEDGAMGSIYIPATDADHSFWKIPGMTKAQAGRRTATIATSANGTAAFHTYQADNFDYNDFGATFVVGNPPEEPGGAETFTATFYDDDDTVLGTIEDLISGKKIDAIDSPADTETKFFKGWSTVKDDESAIVTFPQTVTENVSYYAIYSEAAPVTLIFGSEEIRAFNGDVIDSFPSAPAIEGQNFLGWSTVPDNPSELVTTPYTVDTDESEITFYPIYSIKKFAVTFDMNGGDQDNVTVNNVAYGTDASTIAPAGTYTKTGYTFAGWASSKTATAPETLGAVNAAKTFYAVWTAKNYTVNVYLTEDAAEPYTTVTVTYNGSLPTLSNANKPSAQSNVPANSAFVAWVNKDSGDTVSTQEARPAGTSGKYTTDGDLSVYATWAAASTFSFYIPSTENEGEWVLVGTYTTANWSTIKSALVSKAAELGYAYQTTASTAIERANLAKWYTNEEGTEGMVTLDGKDADGNTVSIIKDPVTNTAYYIGGKRLSNTDVVDGEGNSLLDANQTTAQYENNQINVSLDKIANAAPEGKEFAGYFVDEEGNEVETTVSSSYASFKLTYGTHTYTPAYQDIIYTVLFSIDSYVATADVKYGETLTLDYEGITPYSGYEGFPEIPDEIPDLEADPSASVQLYDKTLKAWGKDGYIITDWVVNSSADKPSLNNTTPYAVNPDDSYVPVLGEFKGKHIINITAKTTPLYYEATFSCGDTGATFPDGETEHTLWIVTGTDARTIYTLAEEAFGIPVKENTVFSSWQPNESMPAQATTFTPSTFGKPVKIFYIFSDLGDEELDYKKLYNNEYPGSFSINKNCGEDGSTLKDEGASATAPYNWAPYSLLMGFDLAPAATFTDDDGNVVEFVDTFGEDGEIIGNMVYVTSYKPFEDCWLILYDSKTSYWLGSILEGVIDKERGIRELFNFSGEELEPGKIEELVGDYTGLTIEQILSQELQKAYNANIYKTVGKDFKTTYWHEGVQVGRKDAEINVNKEEEIIIWYQFKLINFNIKKLFSPEMWKHVYIAGRPVTIPKAWLDPSQTAQTLETIINVVKGLLG